MIDQEKLVRRAQQLVQIPSFSGEEGPLIEAVAAEMRALRFDRVTVDENGSLIGLVQGAAAGPTLLLDAHGDTVGVAPGVPWHMGPFAGEVRNGRLYGRGSSDMKGALAAMLQAAGTADRQRLAGTVAVSVTVMEEVMEGAALQTVMNHVRPDFVVIGEATGLRLNHGGRGRAEIHLETVGKPAHSSTPHLGVNAVHLMLPAIAALQKLPLGHDPVLGAAIMALTDIISDPYPGYSVIPSRCHVTYDRRLLPGETIESALAGLQALPGLDGVRITLAEGKHRAYTGATLSGPKFFPAWKLDPAHPFVQQALSGLRAAGLEPELGAYSFCTNAAYSAGQAGVPTVGFGPSHEELAHVTDEYIELDQLIAAARGYTGIIERVLG
jgi:putative selenium metabolism hydrolase